MCATWNALLNFTYAEIAAAGLTWKELEALSDENAIKLIQVRLNECHPKTDEQRNVKALLSALLVNIASSLAYDMLKGFDWSDTLREIVRVISQNFGE